MNETIFDDDEGYLQTPIAHVLHELRECIGARLRPHRLA